MKISRRIVSFAIAAMLALGTLTACGGTSPSSSNKQPIAPIASPTGQVTAANSRVSKLISGKYTGKLYVDADMTSTTFDGAKKTIIAWDSALPGFYIHDVSEGITTISDGKNLYVANVKDKSAYSISIESEADDTASKTISDMIPDSSTAFGCGTVAIDGVNYYFESQSTTTDGETSTAYYCFDEADTAGASLKYFISETQYERYIYKINSVSGNVDASLFTIPADYKVTDFGFYFSKDF